MRGRTPEGADERRTRGSVDLIHGPIMKPLVLFMLPLLLSNAFQSLYNAVDTAIVGNFLGEHSLAAVGACSSVFDLMVGFCSSLAVGFSLVASRYFGMEDEERMRKAVAGSLLIGGASTAALTLAAVTGMRPLMRLIHTPEGLFGEAYRYILILAAALPVTFAYNLLSAMLRSIGNSLIPLLFLILSSGLNVVLDILFITRFGTGVEGAAAATVIAQGISTVLCLLYILLRVRILIPAKRHFRPERLMLVQLAGQGFSMAFMGSIVNIGTVTLQSGINTLGTDVISGHVAARKIMSLFTLPLFSMCLALSTFVSQNYGAGRMDRVERGIRYTWIYSLAVGLAEVLILTFAAHPLVMLISGSGKAAILGNGTAYLRFASLFFPVLGVLINTRNALQGLQMKLTPLVSSAIELVGKVLFTWLLVPPFGYTAVIVCEPVIWCVMCLQLVWVYRKKLRILKANGVPAAAD